MWEDEVDDGDDKNDDKNNKKNHNSHNNKQQPKHKKKLVQSDQMCVFRIERAWWSEYIEQYELYHTSYWSYIIMGRLVYFSTPSSVLG